MAHSRRTSRIALFSAAAFALAALTSSFASAAPAPAADPKVVAELTAISDRWDKAIVRKDRAAIEANMADDFRDIDGYGNVAGKAAFVDGLVTADLTIDPYTVQEFDVRIYGSAGDVALLSGRTNMTGKYQGKPFASNYRYIDTYAKRDGKWKIVSVQISKMP
ncbi:MAG: nuclear transport factor 2 family protein [Thermoanaerobaculia bacterium]